ncbi:hypothetical protein [Paenibacillus sp. FSL W7-1287]
MRSSNDEMNRMMGRSEEVGRLIFASPAATLKQAATHYKRMVMGYAA